MNSFGEVPRSKHQRWLIFCTTKYLYKPKDKLEYGFLGQKIDMLVVKVKSIITTPIDYETS